MNIGDYVRIKDGYICKIININDFREPTMKYGVEASYLKDIMFIGDEIIIKSSPNIIDLIEVGDYVNGMRISEIKSNKNGILKCMVDSDYEFITTIINSEVESVLTKEQFENMEYKL